MPAEAVFFARNKIQVAIKACTLAKADLKSIFHILDEKNREAAELQVTKLVNNPGQSAEEFSALCGKVRASYKITVTISGSDGEEIFGNDASMFDKPNIPDKIIRAFYSNVTTFQQTFNVFPLNTINLLLDFTKPPIFDLINPASHPTPNASNLHLEGDGDTLLRATQQKILKFIEHRNNKRRFIHMQNFYDLMLYAAGFPFAFYGVSKLGKYAEVLLSGARNIVLYAAYIYIFLVCLVLFRLMFNYTKWVWPTVELSSPNDASVKQRATWGVIVLGIITSMVWDGIKSLF